MVQRQRDARLLRALLLLDPPRGVTRAAWRRYVQTKQAPLVRQVLRDLKQPVEGPTAKPEDYDERATDEQPDRVGRMTRPRSRRSVTIRESLAVTIEQAHPVLGDSLDERVDALLLRALVDLGQPVLGSVRSR